eukprot:COSAG01_NODE_1196_length_11303_cov_16.500714_3_plen_36_part_00
MRRVSYKTGQVPRRSHLSKEIFYILDEDMDDRVSE